MWIIQSNCQWSMSACQPNNLPPSLTWWEAVTVPTSASRRRSNFEVGLTKRRPLRIIGRHRHVSAFSMQIEYWILTWKVLHPIPTISAYSATFPLSSAAVWRSVANHQAPLYVLMCWWAQDYNRGFGIIRHNIPKVAANNSFGILRNLSSDNKAIVFTILFCCWKIATLQRNLTSKQTTSAE